MHLPKKIIALLSLVIAFAPFSQADDGGYIRLSAAHFIPKADSSDDATGALVAFGVTIDNRFSDTANQFELEVGYADWDYAETGVIGGIAYSAKADLKVVPLLLTYRYQWNFNDSIGFAVGPSLGVLYLKASGSATDGVTRVGVSDTDWVLSYGAGAQLNVRLTENAVVTLGYRYLWNEDASFSVGGVNAKIGGLDSHVIELGLRIGWPY